MEFAPPRRSGLGRDQGAAATTLNSTPKNRGQARSHQTAIRGPMPPTPKLTQ